MIFMFFFVFFWPTYLPTFLVLMIREIRNQVGVALLQISVVFEHSREVYGLFCCLFQCTPMAYTSHKLPISLYGMFKCS